MEADAEARLSRLPRPPLFDPAAYQAYVTGVRAEYAHVDAAGWRVGRGQVLRDLLARDPLYATAPARRRWARRAAANMTAELATL